MITHDARRSLSRGNNPVPSPWLATRHAPAGWGPKLTRPVKSLRGKITYMLACMNQHP